MDNFNLDLELFDEEIEIPREELGGVVVNEDDFDQIAAQIADNREAGEMEKQLYYENKWKNLFTQRREIMTRFYVTRPRKVGRYWEDSEERKEWWEERKRKIQLKYSWKKRLEVWRHWGRDNWGRCLNYFDRGKEQRIGTKCFGYLHQFEDEELEEWKYTFGEDEEDKKWFYNLLDKPREENFLLVSYKEKVDAPTNWITIDECVKIIQRSYWKIQYYLWQNFTINYNKVRFLKPEEARNWKTSNDGYAKEEIHAILRMVRYYRHGESYNWRNIAKKHDEKWNRIRQDNWERERRYQAAMQDAADANKRRTHSFFKKLNYKSLFWPRDKLIESMQERLIHDYKDPGSEVTRYNYKKWFLVYIGKHHKVMKHIDSGAIIRKDLDECCTLGSRKYRRKIRLKEANHNLISKRILL
jgi:hypothetical protein